MSTKIGTVEIDIKADTSKLVSGMDRAEKTVKRSVSNIKNAVIGMMAAYVGIESVRAFSGMVSDSIAAADATGKLAQKLGFTTKTMSEYQYAVSFAGIETGKFTGGISSLIRRLKNFQETGGGAGKKGFEALGISAEYARANFKTTDDAFVDILKRLEKMPDGYKKTAAAQDIFSKSSSSMLQLTATDLAKYSKEAQKIGISISQGAFNMAAAYSDEMDSLNARLDGVKQTISFSLLPTMNAVSRTALDMFSDMFGNAPDQMQAFENIAVTSIGNVAYSVGFIKDAFTGVELVLNTMQIAFYSVGYAVSTFIDATITSKINALIDGYNTLANFSGLDTIDNKLVSRTPEITEKIKDLRLESDTLVESLMSGRMSADEFMIKFKANLVKVKQEAKEITQETSTTSTSTNTNYDESGLMKMSYDIFLEYEEKKRVELEKTAQKERDLDALQESNYSSMLDTQISLIESTQDWTNGLEGVAAAVNGIGTAFSKMAVNELNATKAQHELDKKYAADTEKFTTISQLGELEKQYAIDSGKIKAQNTRNEIDGYGQLAGAMAGMFEANSTESKALLITQQALALTNAVASVVAAGTNGDAYTAPARVAAMLAIVTPILAMAGIAFGGGGGGTSSPHITQEEYDAQSVESTSIADKLDRQIELLESIDRSGSASAIMIEKSGTDYESTMDKMSLDIADMFNVNIGRTEIYNDTANWSKLYADEFEKAAGFDLISGGMGTTDWSYTINADALKYDLEKTLDFLVYFSENLDQADVVTDINVDGATAVEEWINDAQNALNDYAMSMVDVVDEMTSASDKFKDLYDGLTGTTKYADADLAQAQEDVDALRGSSSLESYLEEQIQNITAVEDAFDGQIQDLLMSNDPEDMQDQVDALGLLEDATGVAFDNGVEDALNYIDSIELVANAMIESTDAAQGLKDDLLSFADSITTTELDSTEGLAYSMTMLDEAISGFSTATDQAAASSDIMTYANNALSYSADSSVSLADYKYEAAVIANDIRDLTTTIDTGTLTSVEDAIREQTVAIVAELQTIKDNTETEWVVSA